VAGKLAGAGVGEGGDGCFLGGCALEKRASRGAGAAETCHDDGKCRLALEARRRVCP